MAGFVLGAGSGVLAGAAVYYTLSTSLSSSVQSLRTDLRSNSHLLSSSFDPVAPPAPSSLIGPAYPAHQSFSDTVRIKWNQVLGGAVQGVQEADWVGMGRAAWEGGREAVARISGPGAAAEGVNEDVKTAIVSPPVVVDAPAIVSKVVEDEPKRLV